MATPKQQPYLGQKDSKTGKVWAGDGWGWQTPATYTRLAGERRLNTQKNPVEWVNNNLLHLFNTSNQLNKGTKLVGNVGFLPIYEEPGGGVSSSTPAQRQVVAAAAVNAPANAALAATNLGQRLLSGQPLKPSRVRAEDTQVGRAIVSARTQATVGMGAKPVEQLTQTQRDLLVSLPSSLATNAALAFVGPLRAAGPVAGQLATKMPFLSAGAQQVLARGLSWGTNAAVNEAASGLLDDSTQGQAGDLLRAVGAPVPDAFVTQPGDDRIQAGLRGIIPGIAFGEAIGLLLGVASKALDLAPNAMRLLREQRVNGDVTRVRQSTVAAGIQTPDALGGYQFNRDIQPIPEPATAAQPAAATQPTTATQPVSASAAAPDDAVDVLPAPLETADAESGSAGDAAIPGEMTPVDPAPVVDPAPAPVYDPSLLEVDAAALALDRLDDGALTAVAAGGGPVLPRLEEAMANQPRPDVNPERSTLWTAAPAESLVTPEGGWRSQWEQLPNTELIGAAAPTVSPDLFERTQGLTGKTWEEFTRADVLDGLGDLEQSGQVVMPQRLGEGQVLADVQGLQVDPARMQFRGGADPESGVAPGGPEINQWDVSKEGRVSIWEDPQTGDQVLVDGHRRVDAARRLGIPTLPAVELMAPTAEAARAQGANINIAQGSAAPLDGARAFRQQGITDPAGLEAAGIPLDQGTAVGSAAIAGLPDPLFRAVEAGDLPEGRAMAIGGAGLDPEGVAAAGRFARSPRSAQLSDDAFAQLMKMAGPGLRSAGEQVEGAAPRKVSVLDFDRLAPQAQLAADVRKGLGGRELELFDQGLGDPANPVRQLIEQGAADASRGLKGEVLARRIQGQVREAAAGLPPVEQVAADIAPEQAAAPGPMTAADRQALKAQLLQQAIDGGEVRPSAQPVIPSPDPLSVDPIEGLKDLESQLRNTGTIQPDTPAARLLEEEARLLSEYEARDAFIANEMARAQREAAGFWDMSFDERVRQGLLPEDAAKPYWSEAAPAQTLAELKAAGEKPIYVTALPAPEPLLERQADRVAGKEAAIQRALDRIAPSPAARAKRLSAWRKNGDAMVADINAELTTLDSKIEELKSRALSGGC